MQNIRQSWLPRQELLELASTESGHLSLIDALTDGESGLYNHEFFSFKLYEEARRGTRFDSSLSCLLLVLEDAPLRDGLVRVARALRNESRDTDYPCQLDGRSFAVLMPRTELTGAETAAKRVHDQLADLTRPAAPDTVPSFRIGVASALPGVLTRSGELYELACDAIALAQERTELPIASCSKSSAAVSGRARRVVARDAASA